MKQFCFLGQLDKSQSLSERKITVTPPAAPKTPSKPKQNMFLSLQNNKKQAPGQQPKTKVEQILDDFSDSEDDSDDQEEQENGNEKIPHTLAYK